jgi:aminopeptidase N
MLVFDMLARELGEGEFLGMLRTLADKVGNRVIRTSTFFKALERMSGKSLEPFEREFVYGTGIPDIEYEHRGEKTGDAEWTVRGSARQSPSGHLEWTLARAGQTGWDARAAFVPDVDLAVDALTVDYRIDEEEDEKEPSPSEVLDDDAPIERAKGAVLIPAGWRGRTRLPLTGAPFEIRVEHDPKGFRFDDRGETLANFFELAETREALAGSAERAATRGEPEASETLFRRALAAPLEPPDKKRSSARIAAAHATRLDAHIHLGLCRVHLDQGKTDEAAADLEAAEKRLSGPENDALPEERAVLHARLALRRGDFAAAYRRLDTMRVEILQREGESSIDQARRAKFTTGWEGTGEAYALLAVAAHGSDHEEVCAAAREEARRRDADTRVLDALHPTGPANGAP